VTAPEPEIYGTLAVVKNRLHSAGDASQLTVLLFTQIWTTFSVVALSAGVPTARIVRRGVDLRGASPPLGSTLVVHTGRQPLDSADGYLR
jgi:hypothetical protein